MKNKMIGSDIKSIFIPVTLIFALCFPAKLLSGGGYHDDGIAPITGQTNIPPAPPPPPPDPLQQGLDSVKQALDAKGMASGWIDELKNSPPILVFDESLGSRQNPNTALYYPPTNTIHLKPGFNLANMSEGELATFAHEAFHAWYDLVPGWWELWLSDGQEEGIGGFIEDVLEGNGFQSSVSRALTENSTRGGNATSTVEGLIKINEFWGGDLLKIDFKNDLDISKWMYLLRDHPEVGKLESHMSEGAQKALKEKRGKTEYVPEPDDSIVYKPTVPPVEFKLAGGPGLMNGGGDLDRLRTGEQEIANHFGSQPGYTSHYDWDKTRWNSNVEVGVEINIRQPSSPALSIGLSTGFIKSSAKGIEYSVEYNNQLDEEWGNLAEKENWNFTRDYHFQAIPINVDLFLSWPQQINLFGMKVTPFGYAGMGYYFGKMTHSLTQKYLFNQKVTSEEYYDQEVDYSRESSIKEKARSNALGFRGGLGFEINLASSISLGAEVFGRYINFKNWKGDRSESWKTRERWYDESEGGWYIDESDSGSENEHGYLWVYYGVNEIINKKYTDLRIHEESPDSSLYSNIEKAALNLNSFGIKLSIKYRFNFRKMP